MSLSAFPYTQPSLLQLLTVSSFLYLLNVVRVLADYLFYAGLVAELFLGTIYGSPLAGILTIEWEATFSVLGYVGLVCIVFQGGLSTNLPVLLSNLPLSCVCAMTGVVFPIALSIALLGAGYGYRPLEAFAAGAALSSTSLGTTLAALSSISNGTASNITEDTSEGPAAVKEVCPADLKSDAPVPSHPQVSAASGRMQQTRIGTVLISAAIIDDVIGLVIAALIPALDDLESARSSGLAWTIIRPLLSSALVAALTPLVARFILRPLFWYRGFGERWCAPCGSGRVWGWPRILRGTDWGTREHADAVKLGLMMLVLGVFAAITYYTGSSILLGAYVAGLVLSYIAVPPSRTYTDAAKRASALSFEEAYARTVEPVQQYVLSPLFFASIGYAIPFVSLWSPSILWRGVVYALLMCIAKLTVGIPILVCASLPSSLSTRTVLRSLRLPVQPRTQRAEATPCAPLPTPRARIAAALRPAAFLGLAMVARGEIGLLIAQLGRSSALLTADAFAVCVWAVLLCTLAGPPGVALVVRRWGASIACGPWA